MNLNEVGTFHQLPVKLASSGRFNQTYGTVTGESVSTIIL